MSDLVNIISPLSTLLLIIFYLLVYKRNADKKFRVIFLYVILSLIFDLLPHIVPNKRFYLNSFFSVVEYTLISYFLYLSYKEKFLKRLLVGSFFVFVLVCTYSVIYNRKVQFDYLSSSIAGLLVIIFSILFFYEQMKNPEINFVYASKSFWIISAFLIYMAATLFLFISVGVLTLKPEQIVTLWMFNIVFNIIKNILLGIAFYKPLIMSIDSSSNKTAR